ncbi:hypothetical protein L486_05081 [Kwoniella mangroviensis CBS 10435]|uniref:AA1-like domain-containing protein n=1 Tax=Kwoniella mangroviensis CBS 10435 TaxID=1331196 RepID=A0A1B9IQ45_9TREE|nr:hypothetical protein L486_05081 [Kwoniella mangroviensis CBS 10435]OCF75831.1 hypothetical protein I204_03126 [Kwoniella mangroviensis CBS 8886]
MFLYQTFTILALLGLVSATAIQVKRVDYDLKFNIEFDEDSGHQITDKNFAYRYFNFYTYEDDGEDEKSTARFECTLEGLKETGLLEQITYDYELHGQYNWLHSKYRHEEARLTCYKGGSSQTEPDITTDLMPLSKPDGDDDDDDNDNDNEDDDFLGINL